MVVKTNGNYQIALAIHLFMVNENETEILKPGIKMMRIENELAISPDKVSCSTRTRTEPGTSDVAEYIGGLTKELADIASRSGLGTMAYILEMARLEAEQKAVER